MAADCPAEAAMRERVAVVEAWGAVRKLIIFGARRNRGGQPGPTTGWGCRPPRCQVAAASKLRQEPRPGGTVAPDLIKRHAVLATVKDKRHAIARWKEAPVTAALAYRSRRGKLTGLRCCGDLRRRPKVYCRSRGFVYLMAVLLALGASARANGTSDSLFEASRIGDITTLKALLGQSVDVDLRSADGYAALAVAAEPGREDVVDLLLAAGADPNTTTLSGGSAISIALKNNHLGVVASLLAAGADGRVPAPKSAPRYFVK